MKFSGLSGPVYVAPIPVAVPAVDDRKDCPSDGLVNAIWVRGGCGRNDDG